MNDSFFTTRTGADLQFEGINVDTCEVYIDAAVRRIAKLEGPLEAARLMQRLADICAGVHVLPIEHWQKMDAPKAGGPAPKPAGPIKRYLTDNTFLAFWLGTLFGCFITYGKQ